MYDAKVEYKFEVSAVICFWVKPITDTQTHRHAHRYTEIHRPTTKNGTLGFKRPQNV